jgi:GNAT superfamily N-acetyltransferase
MSVPLRISRDIEANRALFARGLPGDLWVGDHHTFWIATDDSGEAVGFCSAVLLPWDKTVFLSSAVVFRAARGNGWQRRMIRHRLRWAARHGMTDAVTYTVRENWPSAVSLLGCGFRTYEPRHAWAGRVWYWHRAL